MFLNETSAYAGGHVLQWYFTICVQYTMKNESKTSAHFPAAAGNVNDEHRLTSYSRIF